MTTELLGLAQKLIPFSLVLSAQLLVVLALRKPVRARLGSIACYWLWMLPLSMPLYFAGDNLVRGLAALAATTSADTTTFVIPPIPLDDLLSIALDGAAGANGEIQWWPILTVAWLVGFMSLLVWQGGRWWLFNRFVQQQGRVVTDASLQAMINAKLGADTRGYIVRGMGTAGLFGIRKPVVLLPESFNEQYDVDQQHIILAHEAVHLGRHDNAWNLGATVVLALFWWNPLLWLAWHCFRFDQELSCDAFALRACSDSQQRRYARTLLDSIGATRGIGSQPMLSAWDNLNDMKERIHMISKHLKNTVSPVVINAVFVLIGLCGAVGTLALSASLTPALAAEPASSSETQPAVGNAQQVSQGNAELLDRFIQLLNAKEFEQARQQIPTLEQAIASGKFSSYEASRALQMMFSVYVQSGQFDDARTAMERAIQSGGLTAQETSTAKYQLAQLWMQQENWQKGVESLEQWLAQETNPKGNAYYLLGVAYYNLDQFDTAIQPAKKAVELDGDKAVESHLQLLSAAYLRTKQYDNVIPVIQEQIKQFPESEKYQKQLGQVYIVQNQFDKALAVYRDLVKAHPENADYQKSLRDIEAQPK